MSHFRVALYDDAETAEAVCDALRAAGFDRAAVAVVAGDTPAVDYASLREVARRALHAPAEASRDVSNGLVFGGAFGALLGLLAAAVWVAALPQSGAIWSGGALLGGALTGALLGASVGAYLAFHYRWDATGAYLEAVRRGAAMVVVRAEDEVEQSRADRALRVARPIDLSRRVTAWRDDDRAARLSRWRIGRRGRSLLPDRPAYRGGTLAV